MSKKLGTISNKSLIIFLVFLLLLITGLIISIAIIHQNQVTNEKSRAVLESALQEFKNNFPNTTNNQVEHIINLYQNAIDEAGSMKKKELIEERIYFLIDFDANKKFGEMALQDALSTQTAEPEENFFINMINVSLAYNYLEIFNEYRDILDSTNKGEVYDGEI